MARVVWNQRQLDQLLNQPSGPTGRHLRTLGSRVEAEQKRLCPVSPEGSHGNPPGHLQDSLHSAQGVDADGQYVDVGTDVDYALYPEFGTPPHVIRSKGDYPLRDQHGNVFGKEVQHPGTPATPYLRPSIEVIRDR